MAEFKELKEQLQGMGFVSLVDMWLEAKTRQSGLSNELPLNEVLTLMASLERIIRHHEADNLLKGLD